MPTTMNTISNPKLRRRWLRFGLRSLLLLVLLIAVSLGWAIHKARQQGIAVAALKEIGCSVSYFDPQLSLTERSLTVLERLRTLLGEAEPRNVTQVDCFGSKISEAGMAHIGMLTQLRR